MATMTILTPEKHSSSRNYIKSENSQIFTSYQYDKMTLLIERDVHIGMCVYV